MFTVSKLEIKNVTIQVEHPVLEQICPQQISLLIHVHDTLIMMYLKIISIFMFFSFLLVLIAKCLLNNLKIEFFKITFLHPADFRGFKMPQRQFL